MFVTFFRSSSYNQWDFCPHSYALRYVLGIADIGNQKADKGNIAHKALELLARKKLAMQNGRATFADHELKAEFVVADFDRHKAMTGAWRYYTQERPTTHTWTAGDLTDCQSWVDKVLSYNGGEFSPLARQVVCPEQYFDLEIRQDWARYDYTLADGSVAKGYLGIKGTIDLVTRANPSTLEYIDYKTGRRINWANNQEKTPEKLRSDPQLLLYHYALRQLYPSVPYIVMTIFYINDGGAFSFPFEASDTRKAEDMLQRRFDIIRATQVPRLNKSYRCTAFCYYGKNPQPGTDTTICEHYREKVLTLGMDRVLGQSSQPPTFQSYGSGGGQAKRD